MFSMGSHKCGAWCILQPDCLWPKRASVSLLHSGEGSLSYGLGWEKRERLGKTKIVGRSGVVAPFISCKSLRLL